MCSSDLHGDGVTVLIVVQGDTERAQRRRGGRASVAGDDGGGDHGAEAGRRVAPSVVVVAATAAALLVGWQAALRLLERDGVDAGKGVAPPGRERGGARGLLGREEGEDVTEHGVVELADAILVDRLGGVADVHGARAGGWIRSLDKSIEMQTKVYVGLV